MVLTKNQKEHLNAKFDQFIKRHLFNKAEPIRLWGKKADMLLF